MNNMKAVVLKSYGLTEKLELQEIAVPEPGDNDVLVAVKASSITFSDMMLIMGKPSVGRLFGMGLTRPKHPTPGSDVAGLVEVVGSAVTRFKPGDAVYADLSACRRGGYAEYACAAEDIWSPAPVNLPFDVIAGVPEAALVALQALKDAAEVKDGQSVLIYGASGGIGTFAVQIAKSLGAEVTGLCGTNNIDMVRSIGADHVIDYKNEDFSRSEQKYDCIIATAGYSPIADFKRALKHRGRYVSTGGSMKQIFQSLLLGPLVSRKNGKRLGSMVVKPNKDLNWITDRIRAGEITPVVDRSYPLEDLAEAIRYYSLGHARGKVIIRVG